MASSHPLDRRTDGSPYPSWGNFAVIGLRAAVGVVAMAVADEEQAGSDPVTDGTVDRIDAFVSYRRSPEDTAFVDELQDALTARGKHVWIDRAEIEPASDWSARIDRGIRSARAFIFVITAEDITFLRRLHGVGNDVAEVHRVAHDLLIFVVIGERDHAS